MKEILDKISSYNIFNYLLPGVLFVCLSKYFTCYNFIQENNLIGAFFYYFIGMIISRVGSLILEPVLRKVSFLKFEDYKKYMLAAKKDDKIELFSEVNNTYRTITSMLFLLMLIKAYSVLEMKYNLFKEAKYLISLILIFIMFLFAYRKQTNFITKRIRANN